jgi:hypothetical protein
LLRRDDEQRDYTGALTRLSTYVAASSAVHRLYSQLRGWWHARQAGLAHGTVVETRDIVWQLAKPFSPAQLDYIQAQVLGYRGRLEQLNARIHAFRARPIYVTQVRIDGRQVDGSWEESGPRGALYVATLQALNRELLGFCREKGEMCIDLAGKLIIPTEEFYDLMHTKPAGSARIAQFLAGELAPIVCKHPG